VQKLTFKIMFSSSSTKLHSLNIASSRKPCKHKTSSSS